MTAHHLCQSHCSGCPVVFAATVDAGFALALHRYCVSFVQMSVSGDCYKVHPWQLLPCLLQHDIGPGPSPSHGPPQWHGTWPAAGLPQDTAAHNHLL